jgi:hypothetical protein
MSLNINNFAASMGSYNYTPVVNTSFNLNDTSGQNVCSIIQFQYQIQGVGTWIDIDIHPSSPSSYLATSSVPGAQFLNSLKWSVAQTLPSSGVTVKVRLTMRNAALVDSNVAESDWFVIKTTSPTVSMTLPQYVKNAQRNIVDDMTLGNGAAFYKASSTSEFGSSWISTSGTTYYDMGATPGLKTIYVKVADQYYNESSSISAQTTFHNTAPVMTTFAIEGTVSGNEWYTGVVIGDDGTFSADRHVGLTFYAEDMTDIDACVEGGMEDGFIIDGVAYNRGEYFPYKITTGGSVSYNNSTTVLLSGSDLGYDADATITVRFRDKAENIASVAKTIRLNTRVLLTKHQLLRPASAEYAHQLVKMSESGGQTVVSESVALGSQFTRCWDEIFYPLSHDFPRSPDGTIDETACIAMQGSSNSQNDAAQMDGSSALYKDLESRLVTVGWTVDGSKDYLNMESSHLGNLRYWTIDNTGYGDFDLQFEHFHLSPNSFGPPYNRMSALINPLASHVGDHLVVYNADADGCLAETIGANGVRTYTLADSSKLEEMYAYTGGGNQVVELNSGRTANADANGAFTVPTMRGVNKVCMILFTDASVTSSGFKLKAGPKHEKVFRNFDVDERNGEVWVHEYPDGRSPYGDAKLIYDYYDVDIAVNHDAGEVSFAADPSGAVTADYTYYLKESDMTDEDRTRMFAVSFDDLVDYLDPSIYAVPSGQSPARASLYQHGYPTPVCPSGKVVANYTFDKDRGVVEFSNGLSAHGDEFAFVPPGRLIVDYFHHTFQRLSNDGYGTLTFRDATIVADTTPLYPDYTWVDVKLVNEGDATLEKAKIRFVSRGYDNNSDGTIDQVLDVNRPWDVQKGTSAETYDKVAMKPSLNYDFPSYITRTEAGVILGYKDTVFPFNLESRMNMWGRVVWVLGGNGGTNYPPTSVGLKCFSSELSGSFYQIQT